MSALFAHQKARQEMAALPKDEKNRENIVQIAERYGLSSAGSEMLVALGTLWPDNKDRLGMVMDRVYDDTSALPIERAYAAWCASSCCEGNEAYDWSQFALHMAEHDSVDSIDRRLIEVKVNWGLWDRGLKQYTAEEIDESIEFLITNGSFDAPGRVKRAGDMGYGKMEHLERVCQMDPITTAADLFYLNWCKQHLAEFDHS